jgi:hypothetical protein
MLKLTVRLLTLALLFGLSAALSSPETDKEVKQILIRESIALYSGSCPCPYNTDRAGGSCGKRSAYSRPGGRAPLCYQSDVTAKMVEDYQARPRRNK